MSDQEQGPSTGTAQQPRPAQPQEEFQVISLDSISAIVKEAIAGVKEYIDDALSNTRAQVIENNKVQIKFRGNRTQHDFNLKQKDSVQKAIVKVQKGDSISTIAELNSVITDIDNRNKLIKLADKSELGWKVVDEYQAEELADNSDDEKRIKAAIKAATAKHNARPKKVNQPRRFVPYKKPAHENYPNPDNSFRRYTGAGRYQPSTYNASRSNDICFACGKFGHWRRSCKEFSSYYNNNKQQGDKTSSQ